MQTPIKTLQIIHLALVAGVTMVYLVIGQINTLDFLKLPELNNTVLVFMFGTILAVFFIKLSLQSCVKTRVFISNISKTIFSISNSNHYKTGHIRRHCISHFISTTRSFDFRTIANNLHVVVKTVRNAYETRFKSESTFVRSNF